MKYAIKTISCAIVSLILVAGMAVFSLSTMANAHDGSSGIIKERQDNMKKIGDEMKMFVKYAKGSIDDTEEVAKSAHRMAKLASHMTEWFPKGTSLDDVKDQSTGAKPAIWEDFNKFKLYAKQLEIEAMKMAEIAESGGDKEAIAKQLGAVGRNGCKKCHTSFRKKLD